MRFLFCSLDSPGYLYPAVGLAKALEARGHTVAFVTHVRCAPLLARFGLRRLERGPNDGGSFEVRNWGVPLSVALQVKHIESALERFPADALVGQSLTLGPLLVKERKKIPVGLLGFFTYLWPAGAPVSEEAEGRKRWRYQDLLSWFNQARALFRLPPWERESPDGPLLGDLFLLRSVPELETGHRRLPRRVHLVGDCLWEPEEPDAGLDAWLATARASGLPLLYVQQGRSFHIPEFWPRLVEALRDFPCRVVASTDRMDGEVGRLPDSFFVRSHVPQGRVLTAASAVVAAATTTAVLGALTRGVPALLIPGGGEQPDVAETCERAGVARILDPRTVTPERIREAVGALLADRQHRDRAALCKASFARLDGFGRAADLLESLAEARRPVLRDARSRRRTRPRGDSPAEQICRDEQKEVS